MMQFRLNSNKGRQVYSNIYTLMIRRCQYNTSPLPGTFVPFADCFIVAQFVSHTTRNLAEVKWFELVAVMGNYSHSEYSKFCYRF